MWGSVLAASSSPVLLVPPFFTRMSMFLGRSPSQLSVACFFTCYHVSCGCFCPTQDVAALGRFTLRDEGRTIAIGKVTKLPKNH